jgi:hypothetical protein
MKLEFSTQIFVKSSNIKFNQNPSTGSRVVPLGRTNGDDEADSRFSQFCERACAPVCVPWGSGFKSVLVATLCSSLPLPNSHNHYTSPATRKAGIAVGIATHYGLNGLGFESRWRRDFPNPSRPPSLLHNRYRVSHPGVKRPGRAVLPPTTI